MSTLKFKCTGCGQSLTVSATVHGKRVRCPKCKSVLSVPPVLLEKPEPEPEMREEETGKASSGIGRAASATLDKVSEWRRERKEMKSRALEIKRMELENRRLELSSGAAQAPQAAPNARQTSNNYSREPSRLKGNGIPCQVCGAGSLLGRKKHRMSGTVVVIGYIILIPSILCVLFSVVMFLSSGGAAAGTIEANKISTKIALERASVPDSITRKVLAIQSVPDAELSSLSNEQRRAVERAQTQLTAGTIGAGIGGAIAGGGSICFGVSAFVGGLLGWLLVMKKKVLQCNNCGAVVAAS